MAVGSGPLDELLLHTEVNKAVVYHPVRSVESQLSFFVTIITGRHEAPSNYMAIVPGQAS